ncbi:MAG: hypothetical protein NVS9B8_10030 [Candidatus Limnocylindrales bacterium]
MMSTDAQGAPSADQWRVRRFVPSGATAIDVVAVVMDHIVVGRNRYAAGHVEVA